MADEPDDDVAEDPQGQDEAPAGEPADGDAAADDGGPAGDDAARLDLERRRKLKWMIIAAGVVVVLVAAAGGLVVTGAAKTFMAWLGGEPNKAVVALSGPPVYHEFPEIVVDLKTGRCRASFIKLRVVAEVSEPDVPRLDAVTVEILDGFQGYLRQRERADLVGEEGTRSLRRAFLAIINKAAEPAKAYNVLFREILLQ